MAYEQWAFRIVQAVVLGRATVVLVGVAVAAAVGAGVVGADVARVEEAKKDAQVGTVAHAWDHADHARGVERVLQALVADERLAERRLRGAQLCGAQADDAELLSAVRQLAILHDSAPRGRVSAQRIVAYCAPNGWPSETSEGGQGSRKGRDRRYRQPRPAGHVSPRL